VVALVTRVLDGDTIEVSTAFQTFIVRYIGIRAPGIAPTVEWQGPQAIAVNERLVKGKHVTLVRDVSETDGDGYYLRYVVVDDIFVNYDIVRQGYALALQQPPDVACDASLMAAQLEAQTSVVGIWVATPMPTFTITPSPTNTLTPTITLTPTDTRLPPCTCRRGMTCNLFSTQGDAQDCYEFCLDTGYGPVLEDKNGNGQVCEGLP
jgi:micrococcal nuclease